MNLTDDELATLITTGYAGATSTVGLTEVEGRGRRRRRNSRLTLATALAATVFAVLGGSAYAVHRIDEQRQVAAFDTACQKAYAEAVASAQRTAYVKATLGRPVIEVRGGGSAIRLYADPVPGKAAVVFDCVRMADGSTSGRLSSRTEQTTGSPPIDAYRVVLSDGSAALIGWADDPNAVVKLTPPDVAARPDVKLAVAQGYLVLWGPRDAVDRAVLRLADGRAFDLARDSQHQPWTFQEAEFTDQCVRAVRKAGRGEPTFGLSVRATATDRVTVYRARGLVAICEWQIRPDRDGVTYHSPILSVARGSTSKEDVGDGLGVLLWSGDDPFVAGLAPEGTESVRLTGPDGTVIDAVVGDGVFAAVGAQRQSYVITMTTAEYVYTFGDGDPKKVRR